MKTIEIKLSQPQTLGGVPETVGLYLDGRTVATIPAPGFLRNVAVSPEAFALHTARELEQAGRARRGEINLKELARKMQLAEGALYRKAGTTLAGAGWR